MERASGLKITVKDSRKRAGDIAVAYVDASKAKRDLGRPPPSCFEMFIQIILYVL